MDNKRKAYFISETVRDPEDRGYIPCIAVEGERGYYRTNWNWGDDIKAARLIADRMNEKLGISPTEAHDIILTTMRH